MKDLLRRQWSALRAWLDDVDIVTYEHLATELEPWTVRDLVAHLGLGLHLSVDVGPAPAGTAAVGLGEYVAQYPPAAPAITRMTQELALSMRDVLHGIDALAAEAFDALDRLDDTPVVQARRGPLTHDDYVRTRLIELVVHGEDLRRALPIEVDTPVLPAARTEVAATLQRAYQERAGRSPEVDDELDWINKAVGRVQTSDPHLPLM